MWLCKCTCLISLLKLNLRVLDLGGSSYCNQVLSALDRLLSHVPGFVKPNPCFLCSLKHVAGTRSAGSPEIVGARTELLGFVDFVVL